MKTVTIAGIEVPMLVNAATSMVHQRIFGEDILVEYNKMFAGKTDEEMGEDFELSATASALMKHLAFTMAMQAEYLGKEEQLLALSDVDFIKWCSQFDGTFALETVMADVMAIYSGEDAATASPKKEDAPQTDR